MNLIEDWEKQIEEGQRIIKTRKPVFGDSNWLKDIPKFNKLSKEKPTEGKLNDLKRIVGGLNC